MQIGLALSGGGFRAVLYHLGVVRFLRDAGLLGNVSHITAVSGGSVLGAHLALNWDRYCGSDDEFDEAAEELIRFLQMDVRNRIVRRFPMGSLVNIGRRALRLQTRRQLTRAGLLERHYERYLYGDTGLFELPDRPRLYILATNLSEGSLCAFHRDGLLLQRRSRGGGVHFEDMKIGLATVPMAVAASSAFPGFFPPLSLRSWEVGAREGQFSNLAFTDGGIYDNVGLRMFHHIQQSMSSPGRNEIPGCVEGERFDSVLVSDAGAKFKVRPDARAGGLLSTALRSSDILMDRVNQMELESFRNTPRVLFFPITSQVSPDDDPYAPHPEVQRHAALMRTDMDEFSDLEISSLVQLGYCVARQRCRTQSQLNVDEIPDVQPWDPLRSKGQRKTASEPADSLSDAGTALQSARELQKSANRRTVSSLLSFRDWPTYIWVPLIVFLVSILPYLLYESNETAEQQGYVLSAVAATSPLYREMLEMLDRGPTRDIDHVEFEEVDSLEPLSLEGFDVLSDDRIYDLRGWDKSETGLVTPVSHARIRVRRSDREHDDGGVIRLQTLTLDDQIAIQCEPAFLDPLFRRARQGNGKYLWEMSLDLSHVPIGTDTVVATDQLLPSDAASQVGGMGRFVFTIAADTGLVRIWMLMPEDRPYENFEIRGYPIGSPGLAETIVPSSTVDLPVGSIATFQLINPKHNYQYECRWLWVE